MKFTDFFKKKVEEEQAPQPWGFSKNTSFVNYSVNYELFLKEGYENTFIFKAMQEIITDCKTIPIGVYSKDKKGNYVKKESNINQWLSKPNLELNGKDFIEYYILYLYFGGGCLFYKTKGINNKQLYIYSPDSFDIKRNGLGNIEEIKIGDTIVPRNEWDSYHICRAVNINDKIAGKSLEFRPIIKSLALPGDMSNLAMIHQNRQLKNSGKRNGILRYKGVMNEEKKQELKDKVNAMGKGEDTGNMLMVNAESIDFAPNDMTAQEMDWLESLKYIEEIITYALGVPLQLVSSRGSTYSNLKEMKKKVYIDTAIPLIADLCEDLTAFFSSELGENEKIWYDVSGIEELKQDTQEIAKGIKDSLKGVATTNEVRAEISNKTGMSLKPLPKEIGDKILVSSSEIFLDDLNYNLEVPQEKEEDTTK